MDDDMAPSSYSSPASQKSSMAHHECSTATSSSPSNSITVMSKVGITVMVILVHGASAHHGHSIAGGYGGTAPAVAG